MADLFNIGLSGLKASQTNLSVTGQNISNINTPGYTRQTALQAARDPSFTGAGYIGNGTNIVDVQRIHNQFLTNQVRTSTSMNAEVTAFQSQIEELNGLLAGNATGINPAMQSYFGALQTAIEDPASLPARQLFLAEAEGLAGKFNTVGERLTVQNEFLGQQMGTVTDQVSRLASNIASYNESIAKAAAQGAQPNDLLDARDEAIRQLSQYVGVTVVPQDDNTVNLFVGTGQPLVVGNNASSLTIESGRTDPTRVEIHLKSGNTSQNITGLVSGGELGGILRYRGELDNALNSVGRLALSMASEFNEQLAQGLDLNGEVGTELFVNINASSLQKSRSNALEGNASNSALNVSITDTKKLTLSDYEVTFTAPPVAGSPSTPPTATIRAVPGGQSTALKFEPDGPPFIAVHPDGFEITAPATIKADDRFLVMPTRSGAAAIDVQMKNPQDLAFAAPLSGEAGSNNRGSAQISQPVVTAGTVSEGFSLGLSYDGSAFSFGETGAISSVPETYVPGRTTKLTVALDGGPTFEVVISGTPLNGDNFDFGFNSGTSDNRNALELSKLQTSSVLDKYERKPNGEFKLDDENNLIEAKGMSFADGYGTLIQQVGTQTAQARSESEASGAVLKQATNNRDSVSAVNLDEEAANLMKFEQYYNASAQVIQIARSIFDTLINSIR